MYKELLKLSKGLQLCKNTNDRYFLCDDWISCYLIIFRNKEGYYYVRDNDPIFDHWFTDDVKIKLNKFFNTDRFI